MTEERVQEIEAALRATKGDTEFAVAWLDAQPDIALLNCTADEHPELCGPESPYVMVVFVGDPRPEPLVVLPHAPAGKAREWHERIEAAAQ